MWTHTCAQIVLIRTVDALNGIRPTLVDIGGDARLI